MSPGLVAFLKARIDEDERELAKDPPAGLGYANLAGRMRREITAKRTRLALLDEAVSEMDRLLADDDAAKIDQGVAIGRKEAALTAVKYDAAVYDDHPDYQPEWAPQGATS